MNRIVPIVFLAITLAGCVDRAAQQQAKRTEQLLTETVKPVVAVDVATRTLEEVLTVSGEIQTADDTLVGAKVGGRLVAVYVRDGDPVRPGQVIARQETADSMARLQQAQAQANAARAAYQQALRNQQIGPSKSTSAVKSAEAQLKSAKAQLAKLRAGARDEERVQSQASVAAAKSNLDTAKNDLDRSRNLYAEGAISKQQLEAAENRYASALAQYETALQNWNMIERGTRREDLIAAEQQVAIAEEALRTAKENQRLDPILRDQVQSARANLDAALAGVRLAQQSVEDAIIRSPFSGRVSGKPTQVGAYVGPGSAVARIVGVEGVYFEGEIPESLIQRVQPGRQVDVTIEALDNLRLSGTVVAVNPLGQEVGRIFKARVRLDNPGPLVKPGMFGTGRIVVRTIPDAIVVPQSAVLTQGSQQYVFIVAGDAAKRTPVTTGLTQDGVVQVDGLRVGDKVIVRGQTQLIDGAKVKVEAPAETAKDN
jgi:RND family efflux transporter MFP subunit